jgi:adenosine kinase
MKILVSGSIAYDYIMDFPGFFKDHILPERIHAINVSFLVNQLKINFGGTAGNIAYSLALLGESPVIISTAGSDFEKYQKWLEKSKIDYSEIKIIDHELTAVAHIVTDMGDNQITAFYPGAMRYSGGEIKKDLLNDVLAIVAPGFDGDMKNYPKVYKKNNVPYIYDPGQQITALQDEDLREGISGAKVFISNDYELSLIAAKTGWGNQDIMDRVEIMVTTMGEKGAVIKTGGKLIDIAPARVEKVVDPTGAGDMWRAGFIKGLVNGWSLEKSGRLGSVVSAYGVETYGTQTHNFSWDDVSKRYRDNFGEEI